MRDLAEFYTRGGTPLIVVLARMAFAGFFTVAVWSVFSESFPHSDLDLIWVLYLAGIYGLTEYLCRLFGQRGIDLSFSLPLLFAVYCLNLVSMLSGAQEQLPLLNRAEHFASFILVTHVVWIFFIQYLPQRVWREHRYYTALLVLAVTALAGVGNEVFELLADQLLGTTYVGLQYDTSYDLLMNLLGSGLYLATQLILGGGGSGGSADRPSAE